MGRISTLEMDGWMGEKTERMNERMTQRGGWLPTSKEIYRLLESGCSYTRDSHPSQTVD